MPTIGFGYAGWAAFAEETTYNTPVTPPTVYKELLEESVELKQSAVEKPVLGSTSITHFVKSKSSTEGTIKFQVQFNDIERLMKHCFGTEVDALHAGNTAAWDHTFTVADALPAGMTWYINRDSGDIGGSSMFQYPGMMVDKLTLTQEVENFLLANVALIGSGVENLIAPVSKPGAHAFTGIDYTQVASVTVNGVSIPAKMSEFTIENQLSKERYKLGSNTRIGLQRGNVRKVTGKLTLEFQSTTQIALFEAFTPFQVVVTWTGGTIPASSPSIPYQSVLTLNNCVLSGKTPNVKNWDVIQQELDFQAFYTNASEISLVITNDVNTPV